MVARGELGHPSAVGVVHADLRMHGVGEQAAVINRNAGFIAGGLDAEDQHWPILLQFSPFSSPRAGCRQYASRKTSRSRWPCAASSAPWRRPACLPSCAPASTTKSRPPSANASSPRSEEHTSELQSQSNLVCRL